MLDLGHHIPTVSFSDKATTLTIKKNVETLPVAEPLFTLNQWRRGRQIRDRGNAISALVAHHLSDSAIGCAPVSSGASFPGGSFNARSCIEARSDA